MHLVSLFHLKTEWSYSGRKGESLGLLLFFIILHHMKLPIEYICSNLCEGEQGYHGGCCTLEDRDFIIGTIHDKEEFIKRLEKLRGEKVNEEDIFYTYEEGSKLFPHLPSWQLPFAYPALKVNLDHPKKPCIFYDTEEKQCSIHSIRPTICRNYSCKFLSENS